MSDLAFQINENDYYLMYSTGKLILSKINWTTFSWYVKDITLVNFINAIKIEKENRYLSPIFILEKLFQNRLIFLDIMFFPPLPLHFIFHRKIHWTDTWLCFRGDCGLPKYEVNPHLFLNSFLSRPKFWVSIVYGQGKGMEWALYPHCLLPWLWTHELAAPPDQWRILPWHRVFRQRWLKQTRSHQEENKCVSLLNMKSNSVGH